MWCPPPFFKGVGYGIAGLDRDMCGVVADFFGMKNCYLVFVSRVIGWLGVFALVAFIFALTSVRPAAAFSQPTGIVCGNQTCEQYCISSTFISSMAGIGHNVSFHSVSYVSLPTAVCLWNEPALGLTGVMYIGNIYAQSYPSATSGAITPANASCSGGSCTCNASYAWNGSICVSGCTGEAKRFTYFAGYDPQLTGRATVRTYPSTLYPPALASNGCAYQINPSASSNFECYAYPAAPTKIYCDANYTASGVAPTGSEPAPDTPSSANPCPTGQSIGLINGIPQCFGTMTALPPVPTTTTTVNAAPVVNGDGTTTSVSTTTAPNGERIVTTVITDTATARELSRSSTQTLVEVPKSTTDKFCVDNPQTPLCKVSTFTGNCNAVPTCDGDAVQCATARAVFAMNCELAKTSTLSVLGDAVAAGSDPLASSLPSSSNFSTVNVAGLIDSSDALSGSGCLADQTFDFVSGQTFTLPWSQLCGSFVLMGYVLMVCSALGCARIVGIWG